VIRPFSISRISLGLLCVFTVAFQTGCEKRTNAKGEESWHFIGEPRIENKWVAPTEITDFVKLYNRNCLGCHSNGPETVSASIAMDNADYLSIVPREVVHNAIANGLPGTLMPGFSIKAGGELTDEQINILTDGIMAKKPATVAADLPAYSAPLGNAANGKALYETSVYGKVTEITKSVLNPYFLDTVSDQYIRTFLIVGLPELGYPDFRALIPGKTLTSTEISNLTAWIVSNRKNEYGEPLAAPATAPEATPPAPAATVP
jgi:cytochrome c oxidase cbb3-type subunit III